MNKSSFLLCHGHRLLQVFPVSFLAWLALHNFEVLPAVKHLTFAKAEMCFMFIKLAVSWRLAVINQTSSLTSPSPNGRHIGSLELTFWHIFGPSYSFH